jgi:hypothetical protein
MPQAIDVHNAKYLVAEVSILKLSWTVVNP